jgi:hypothetical protein
MEILGSGQIYSNCKQVPFLFIKKSVREKTISFGYIFVKVKRDALLKTWLYAESAVFFGPRPKNIWNIQHDITIHIISQRI